jgi:hypothetical protein
MTRIPFIFALALSVPMVFQAQERKLTLEEYILRYQVLAIREMELSQVPASITMAQAVLESANGNSTLAREANNHFGIKCHKGWTGETFYWDDDHQGECFRKYRDAEESFRDHSVFLSTRDRYAFLFELPQDDYKGWARGLKQAGYATNPRYPELLIKIIEENELYLLDQKARPGEQQYTAGAGLPPENGLAAASEGLREILRTNNVPYIMARPGDTDATIAAEFNIYSWQVRKYNDREKPRGKRGTGVVRFREGERIYLEPKKRKAGKGLPATHTLSEGEGLAEVSQLYAVRLKDLCKMNAITGPVKLDSGQVIRLR